MSRLTIDAVHTKKQVYPVIINFQNGYPTDDFEIDCALVLQGRNSIRTIATELDELVYAGQENYEDLGRTFILARDKNTGKVRLIESGSAELKPQNEDNQLLEKNKLETETSTTTSHIQQEIDQIVSDRLNCIPMLRECDLEPDIANYLPHEETSFVNPNINNHSKQLEIPYSSNSSQFNTDVFVPDRSNSPQKLNNEGEEPDLNMLFSIAPEQNELQPNKYDSAEQDTCESELNITNSHEKLEISKTQRHQVKTNFRKTIESEANQLQQVKDELELNKVLDLNKSNLSQPLKTAELEYDKMNHSEQLSPGELDTGYQIQIEVEVLDLNRLPGEAGLAGEAGLIGKASLAGDDGLAREAGLIGDNALAGEAGLAEQSGLIGDDGLSEEASLTGEASLTEDDGLARETGPAGEASLAGDGGLKLPHEKNKVDSNTAKTLEDQETSICEQNFTSKTQVSDANGTEFARLLVEKHSIVPEQANDDEHVEKDIDELNFVDSTTELRDGKYNHMMNYYHDELFVPNNSKTNLTNNNEKRECFKDFSTVKEIFTESLGLKRKVHKKLKTQNVIRKNHMNKQKNNVFITRGHKAIINKQTNDDNKTQNIISHKYSKQTLVSQAYTCDYCKNVFEDKDSLIFHLVSHKFIRNTKNVVLKPLVERIVEAANTKSNTCRINGNNKRNKKKRNGLYGPENRTSTPINNTVQNSKTTEKYQSFYENDQTINNAINRPIHFTKDSKNGSKTAGNLYICNHCKERFKDEDSQIFHFGTCINSLKTSENVKGRKDESIEIYDDATTNREAHKTKESAAVFTEQAGHVQKLCNEIKIADNFENCPIHLEKDNSRENNESPIIPEINYICEHCEKSFEEKGSLIFHLVAHKINNTIEDTTKEDTHKIKCDRNNTIGEKTKCVQSSENINDKDAKNHKLRNVEENGLLNPEQSKYVQIDNIRKVLYDTRNDTENNTSNLSQEAAGNNFICNYCEKAFVQKGLLICHIATHQIYNSLEIANASTRRFDKSYMNKKKENETIKIIEENCMSTSIDIKNHETNKVKENILVNPEENENTDMYTEVEITDNSRKPEVYVSNKNQNIVKTINACAYDYDGAVNYTQKLTPEKFEEKESHILHLGAHRSSNKYQKHKEIVENSKGVCENDAETHKTKKTKNIETSNSRINRSHSKDKINNAINVRQLRSSNKNQKHKEIVHNVCVNKNSKSACNNIFQANIIEKSETISLNSRINSSQLEDKINVRWLRSFNTNHIKQKHKETLVDICSNSPKGVRKENIVKKDKTSLDNFDKTSPIININASQSKKVLRVLLTPLENLTNDQKSNKVSMKTEPSANNNFICNDCGRVLKSKDTLIAHLESHSNNSKVGSKKNTRKCDTCQSKFATLSELINHEIKAHNTTKAYKSCTLCEYKTLYKSNLADHKRAHLNIKSFKCSYCVKAFGTMSILRRHIRRHKGEKPFKCEICSKAFCVKSDLDLHGLTHAKKEFKCTNCRKTFVRATDLKRHMIIHSNKKPFKCATCSSSFNDRSALLSHERKHTGEKPYRYKVLRISA